MLCVRAHLARLSRIPFPWIAPFLIVAIPFATLHVNRDPRDLFLAPGFGMVGIAMRRFGFVLQANPEKTLCQTAQLYDLGGFRSRPMAIGRVAIVPFVLGSAIKRQFEARADAGNLAALERTRMAQLFMPGLLAAFFLAALAMVSGLQPLGRMFPMVAGAAGAGADGARGAVRARGQQVEGQACATSFGRTLAWLIGAASLIAGFGFFAGASVFMAGFLAVEAGTDLPDGRILSLNPWDALREEERP